VYILCSLELLDRCFESRCVHSLFARTFGSLFRIAVCTFLVRSNFWIAVSNRGVYILGPLELLDRCFESRCVHSWSARTSGSLFRIAVCTFLVRSNFWIAVSNRGVYILCPLKLLDRCFELRCVHSLFARTFGSLFRIAVCTFFVRSNFWIAVSNRGVYILCSLELLVRCFESRCVHSWSARTFGSLFRIAVCTFLVRSNFWIAVSNCGVYILGPLELLVRCFESRCVHSLLARTFGSRFRIELDAYIQALLYVSMFSYTTVVVLSCSVRFLLREPSLIRSNNFENQIDTTLWI
jgi:hypothetical protein